MKVAIYRDSDQLYQVLDALFSGIREVEPEASRAVQDTRLAIRMRLLNPDAVVNINARQSPLQISFGMDGMRPGLEVEITANAFHYLMWGKLSFKQAFASGDVKVKGQFWKALKLEGIFHSGRSIYQQICRQYNLET